jgi:hypothetical protein
VPGTIPEERMSKDEGQHLAEMGGLCHVGRKRACGVHQKFPLATVRRSSDCLEHYFIFSQIKVITLILPSAEKGCGLVV